MKRTLLVCLMILLLAIALVACDDVATDTQQTENDVPNSSEDDTPEPDLEPCEHDWANATCIMPKICQLCGAAEGEPLGHAEETIPAVEATCAAAGSTEGKKCSSCGEILVAPEEIAALDHAYGDWVITKQPTDDDPGSKYKTCGDCGHELVETIPPKFMGGDIIIIG